MHCIWGTSNKSISPVLASWLWWRAWDVGVLSLSPVGHWLNTRWGWLGLSSFWGRRSEFQCTVIVAQHQRHSRAPTKWYLPGSQAAISQKKKKKKKNLLGKLKRESNELYHRRTCIYLLTSTIEYGWRLLFSPLSVCWPDPKDCPYYCLRLFVCVCVCLSSTLLAPKSFSRIWSNLVIWTIGGPCCARPDPPPPQGGAGGAIWKFWKIIKTFIFSKIKNRI